MKTTFFTALGLTLAIATAAHAADPAWRDAPEGAEYDRTGRFDTGIYGAGTFIESGDADNSGFAAIDASYGIRPWAAVGVEGGYTQSDTDLGEDLEIAIFMAEMIVRFEEAKSAWNGYRLVPYASFGLGGMWTSNDDSLAWKAGLGADWFLNRHWAINVEADYYQSFGEIPVHPSTDPENKLEFWTVGGGLKYVY